MRITYKLDFDSAYCRSIVRHYYRQRPYFFRLEIQFALTLIPLACWWLYEGVSGAPDVNANVIATSLVAWLAIAVAGILVTKWGILQRVKGKVEFGSEVTMILSDAGVEAIGQHVSGKWSWAAYPRAARFSDGILLQRAGAMRWLPDSAIQDGSPELASELVASKTDFRRVP
jgi:hypothetical protein